MLFKRLRRARLHHEAGTRVERTAFDRADRVGGEDHDRDVGGMRIVVDFSHCAEPVEARHCDIHHDHVRVESMRGLDGGNAIGCGLDDEATILKVDCQRLARIGDVIDYEDATRVTRCSTRLVARTSAIHWMLGVGWSSHGDLLQVRYRDPYRDT